jgi:hypothetical protein
LPPLEMWKKNTTTASPEKRRKEDTDAARNH